MNDDIKLVGYADDSLADKAQQLASQLTFSLEQHAARCLFVTAEKLTLKIPHFSLLSADFSVTTWSKRRAEGKKQGLVRACKPAAGVTILDATAGWGRDAAVLASFGAQVLMLERHPVMAALLADALTAQSEQDKAMLRLSLCHQQAATYLSQLSPEHYPDVIYVDPMHPERHKSALVKKDLQALQQMIGADLDAVELIQTAITRVKRRVVVKWPQKLAPLVRPDSSIDGKTVRFDIYLAKKEYLAGSPGP